MPPLLVLTTATAFATALAAGPCAAPSALGDLRFALDRAEAAWGSSEAEFESAVGGLDGLILCLDAVVPPLDAARVHRVEGLAAFVRRDRASAELAFASARLLDPGFVFPEALIPAGNPVDTLYRAAAAPGTAAPLPAPKKGWRMHLDGSPAAARPDGRALVAQVVDPAGRIVGNDWTLPDEPLPAMPTWRDGLRGPLLAVAGGLAAAGGGLWATSAFTKDDPATFEDPDALDVAVGRHAAMGGAAIGLGALGVGTAGAAMVVGRW